MQVFKFGGASVKDAESIQNVASILKLHQAVQKVVVISAMGKTTNAMEDVVNLYIKKDEKYIQYLHEIREYHMYVGEDLFPKGHSIFHKLFALFDNVEQFCSRNISENYNFIYDQIVSLGELASTTLISAFLNENGIENKWVDAREIIRTDHAYTDAQVDWETTQSLVNDYFDKNKSNTYITQGFIGSTSERFTTTLGREGSDFTAAILSYCLNAEVMKIWKDVEGVMNADPKVFPDATLIDRISFTEAIEMTYYGAKVIHPKTIRPLQNKGLALEVRSFINYEKSGTLIHEFDTELAYPPIIVRKEEQVLLRFSAKDFSFIAENHMESIFGVFANHRLRMNIMQNGAIHFSAVVDNKEAKINEICKELAKEFLIEQVAGLELLTIRHYNEDFLNEQLNHLAVRLTQKTKTTIQVLYDKENDN